MSWQPSRAGVICLLCLVCGLALTQAPARPNPYPEGDHPEQRVDWFMRFRQSRDSESPAAHRLEALRQARRMMTLHRPRRQELAAAGASPASIGGDWTELGPKPESDPSFGNVGGRLTAIAVDPKDQTVYLGAADGGLWKSTNALSPNPAFTPIGDNLPSLSIGSIALDATTTPTTIYVGTGEPNFSQDSYYGDGIFKSTDGGQTWTAGTGVDFTGSAISKLLVDPDDSKVLLAAVTEGGVYSNDNLAVDVPAIGIVRSTDNGQTWSRAYSGDHSGLDLVYDASRKTFYAAIRSQGIFQSTDEGATWAVLPQQPFFPSTQNFTRASLAVRGGVLYALITDQNGVATSASDCTGCTGLVASGDGGQTWTLFTPPAGMFSVGKYNQGTYDQFIAAPPGTTGLVLGGIDVWSGNPSTNNWTNLTNSYTAPTITPHPDQHAIVCLSASTCIIGNDGGAWSTADGGKDWTNMNATLGAIQFYSVSADPATAGRLIGGSQDNGTAMATAGSLTWPNKFGGDGGHTAITPANPQQVFTENFGVSLVRSDDGGTNWEQVVDDTTIPSATDHGEFYIPYTLDPTNPAQVYLLTQRVWRGPAAPTAQGAGWTPISGDLTHAEIDSDIDPSGDDLTAIAVAPSDGNVVYVGAFDGSLSGTLNANSAPAGALPTWTKLPASLGTFVGPLSALAVSPADAKTLYWGYAFLGGSSARMYKSTDGGQTRIDISGDLPAVPINAILVDPQAPADIYVATDVGVFVTSDGGTTDDTWVRLGDNLPAAAVLSLSLTSASGSPVLVAGTHGRGAWSIPAIAPASFTMTLSPATARVEAGQPAVFQLQTTAFNGSSTISLDCGDFGPDCSISPSTIQAGDSATVTIATHAGVNPTFNVHATNGTYDRTVQGQVQLVDFTVFFGNQVDTLSAEVKVGTSYTESVWVDPVPSVGQYYDAPIDFSCPNAPAGVTCSFAPASLTLGTYADEYTNLTVQVAPTATPQQIALDIRGTGGSLHHDVTLNLDITQLSVAISPNTVTADAGTAAQFTVTVTPVLSGYSKTVTLGCEESGIVCSFQPPTLSFSNSDPQTSALAVTGFQAQPGSSNPAFLTYTVTAAAGSDLAHKVFAIQPIDFLLRGAIAPPTLLSGAKTATLAYYLVRTNGFAGNVDMSCATAGVTCTFATSSNPATVTFTGLDSYPPSSDLPVTIVGSSGGLQRSYTYHLNTAGDFLFGLNGPTYPALVGGQTRIQVQTTSVQGFVGHVQLGCAAGQGVDCTTSSWQAGGGLPFIDVSNLPAAGPFSLLLSATATDGGATVTHTLSVPLTLADFSLSAGEASLGVNHAGGTALEHLTVHFTPAASTFLQVSCSGYPGVSCGQTVNVSDGSLVTVSIVLDPGSGSGFLPPPSAPSSGWPWLLLLVTGGLTLMVRRRRRLALIFTLALVSGACGGGGGGGGGAGGNAGGGGGAGFQPVTVPIVITATDAAPGLTHPDTHAVTVQLTLN